MKVLTMARYRRRSYRRRRSTRTITMKFQSFMDISTSDSSMQVITVSAGGKDILRRLSPQFAAYKYYKIGNISVKLVPASTLPVDPTGLSYTVGENSVDPRDQLTPGLMRITNGEDVFEDISGLDVDQQHAIFNNMLLDPRWFKWMLQSGVRRSASPRYWQVGQLHQDKFPGWFENVPTFNSTTHAFTDTSNTQTYVSGESVSTGVDVGESSKYGLFQTGHRGVLGWMPTDGLLPAYGQLIPSIVSPPEVEVMKIILPRAYKTRYYYRMFITETVYFKDPIVNFGITAADGFDYRPLDVFHSPIGTPMTPDNPVTPYLPDTYTGGNYGDH